MQANEDVARKLAQLTLKAEEQRARIQSEILQIREKPSSAIRNISVDAVKTMHALGLDSPKVALPLAKSVILPAALAAARLIAKKGSPRRFLGVALIAASSFGIFKGIEYDKAHPISKASAKETPEGK